MADSLENLSIGNIQLLQSEKGYRYSIDPILLARFVQVKNGACVVDLGTGCGILPVLLGQLSGASELVGVELQTDLAGRASQNVILNSLQERVKIVHDDIRNVRNIFKPATIDIVVSNPPYRHPNSGRIAPNDERAAARHELAGGLPEFITAARWLLKTGGYFAVVYLAQRLPELIATMIDAGIEPKRLRMVHPRYGSEAKMVLLEGRRGGRPGLQVESPLYIYNDSGTGREYTEEVLEMYDL